MPVSCGARAPCMLDKHSNNWAMIPTQIFCIISSSLLLNIGTVSVFWVTTSLMGPRDFVVPSIWVQIFNVLSLSVSRLAWVKTSNGKMPPQPHRHCSNYRNQSRPLFLCSSLWDTTVILWSITKAVKINSVITGQAYSWVGPQTGRFCALDVFRTSELSN